MLIIPSNEYAAYHGSYIAKVQSSNLLQAFLDSREQLLKGAQKIAKNQENFRYQPEKWSVKEVLQHITDTERIFAYRALCFARGEKNPLLGFDENEYAKNSYADEKELSLLTAEFAAVRAATIALFTSFNEQQLMASGTASNNVVSVRAIGAIIVGHQLHHLEVLNVRYGLNF